MGYGSYNVYPGLGACSYISKQLCLSSASLVSSSGKESDVLAITLWQCKSDFPRVQEHGTHCMKRRGLGTGSLGHRAYRQAPKGRTQRYVSPEDSLRQESVWYWVYALRE